MSICDFEEYEMKASAVWCGGLAAAVAKAAAAMAASIAISHVTVIDTMGGPAKTDMTVVVKGHHIAIELEGRGVQFGVHRLPSVIPPTIPPSQSI